MPPLARALVLGTAVLAVAAPAAAVVAHRDEADLTTPSAPTTAVARADERALARMTPTILAMCEHEGFPAHANAVAIRRDRAT